MANFYDFQQPLLDGTPCAFERFRGQVALIVNVASRCGLTPQYRGLEDLFRTYGERGLVVIGAPCNQFGAQEPGTPEEIQSFCSTRYDITFPMLQKLEVNGPGRHPLYQWMCEAPTAPEGPGDIGWNFGKFLVGRDGTLVARFSPTTAPNSPLLVSAVEGALG